MYIKTQLIKLFAFFGIGISKQASLLSLRSNDIEFNSFTAKIELVAAMNNNMLSVFNPKSMAFVLGNSKSQLGQDLLALALSDLKQEGFFVEFGATNGKDLSNTFILEKSFGWNGILAEPARSWHHELASNRDCKIETDCVWTVSNASLLFNEVPYLELSTINSFSEGDMHVDARKSGKKYQVKTISLNDLLTRHDAPNIIDYLSIDTEGSEFEILKSFDFERHQFNFISCEHNFTDSRIQIYELLTAQGYTRILENISKFDDWYVHKSLVESKGSI